MPDKIELDTGTDLPSSFVLTEEFKNIFNTIENTNPIYSLPEKQDVESLLCLNTLGRIPKDLMRL